MKYLKFKVIVFFTFFISIVSLNHISAQNLNHRINNLNVGDVLVCNKYFKENNKKIIKHDYQALSRVDINYDNCLRVLKSTSYQAMFIADILNAEKLISYSDNQWLNYYSFRGCGNHPPYDCVMEVQIIENKEDRYAFFMGKSSAEIIEDKGLLRIENYEIQCVIRELESGQTEISLFASYNPLFSISKMKLHISYPNPIYLIKGIVYAAKSIQ